jgi:hypothetical protein
MEHVGDVAKRVLRSSGSRANADSKEPSSILIPKRIEQLFMALAGLYLHKWMSAFPTSSALQIGKAQWARELEGVTDEAIARGLSDCGKHYREWPPTAPQFRELCTAAAVDYEPWMSGFPQLSHHLSQVTAPGDARVHLARMRERLRGRRNGRV